MAEENLPQPEPDVPGKSEAAPAEQTGLGRLVAALRGVTGTQLILGVNTLAVALLAFGVAWLTSRPTHVEQAVGMELPLVATMAEEDDEIPATRTVRVPVEESVSFDRGQAAYESGDYESALGQYVALTALAEKEPSVDRTQDFFRLRAALCCQKLGRVADAAALLGQVDTSSSPVVRAMANYHLAVIDEYEGRYLQARMRAYLAAAATMTAGGLDELANDCEFLIARALTQKALSYYGHRRTIPWGSLPLRDSLMGLTDAELQQVLVRRAGIESEAMLGPRVQQSGLAGQVPLWTATSMRAPVGDLLHIFAAEAHLDLQWVLVSDSVRTRAVSLHLPDVSSQRLCEVAAGCAGLVARFTGEKVIVHNPPALDSVTDQRTVLVDEAVSEWRRLFLRSPHDERIAEGYFALGLLHECSGLVTEAINDYQLTARRFARAQVAPPALLRSARLLSELRDYSSARKELLELLDCYPECRETAEAYGALGEATLQAGRTAEAYTVFRKLFYMDLSPQASLNACLGAGKCLYVESRYDEATQWLIRYVELSQASGQDLSEAYLLLGRSYHALGDAARAVAAFHQAMAVSDRPSDRVAAGLDVSRAYMDTGDLARALGTLRSLDGTPCTPEQDYQVRLLTTRLYRAMGLSGRAAAYLRGTMKDVTEPAYRALLAVELGRCYAETDQLTEAADLMAEALGQLGAGEDAHVTACDLADICLKIDRPAQAATLAREVLASSATDDMQQRARCILAEALLAQQQYSQAAVALVELEDQPSEGAPQ